MINKVKPPVPLKLVHSSKQAKNDLGGQGGEAYSQNPSPDKKDEPVPVGSATTATPDAVAAAGSVPDPDRIGDQVGLTQVMKEWLQDGKNTSGNISRQKMSAKYQGDSAPAKGMLLNKKIS